MESTLKRLGDLEITPSPGEPKFVRPQTIFYHLDGRADLSIPCALEEEIGVHPAGVALMYWKRMAHVCTLT